MWNGFSYSFLHLEKETHLSVNRNFFLTANSISLSKRFFKKLAKIFTWNPEIKHCSILEMIFLREKMKCFEKKMTCLREKRKIGLIHLCSSKYKTSWNVYRSIVMLHNIDYLYVKVWLILADPFLNDPRVDIDGFFHDIQ